MSTYPERPDPSTNKNLDSLSYRYHVASPKQFTGMFRTHTEVVSTTPPVFPSQCWHRLSNSGTMTRYLALEGAEYHATSSGAAQAVHGSLAPGGIVLVCPGPNNTWMLRVPDGGYTGKSCRGIDLLDRTHGTDRGERI